MMETVTMATVLRKFALVTLLIGVHVHAWTNTKMATTNRRSTASILSCTTIRPSRASAMHHASALSSSSSSSSSDDEESSTDTSFDDDTAHQDNNWLEMWALEGAKKIASLDINERTQRAMLAEICEDEIYQLTIELESLVDESTGEISSVDRAREIATRSRSLQQQYRNLVSGEPSTVLSALSQLKTEK